MCTIRKGFLKELGPCRERKKVLEEVMLQLEGTGQFEQKQHRGHEQGAAMGPRVGGSCLVGVSPQMGRAAGKVRGIRSNPKEL